MRLNLLEIVQHRWIISSMIARATYLEQIRTGLNRAPIVALIRTRQCGKTTLARQLLRAGATGYLDLEDPASALAWPIP